MKLAAVLVMILPALPGAALIPVGEREAAGVDLINAERMPELRQFPSKPQGK